VAASRHHQVQVAVEVPNNPPCGVPASASTAQTTQSDPICGSVTDTACGGSETATVSAAYLGDDGRGTTGVVPAQPSKHDPPESWTWRVVSSEPSASRYVAR